jgi:NAD+ synthase (glutamine-hydrolysing)
MNIALAQLNFHIGNFEGNTQKIIQAISRAQSENVDLIVFSELAVCGYPPLDLLEYASFITHCEESLEEIAKHTKNIAVIVGCPTRNTNQYGRKLHNSACFIADGKIISVHHKALLPNYDVFDEFRYFEPGELFSCIRFKGKKIALSICEDLWDLDDSALYSEGPMDSLSTEKPDFIVNIAASPFAKGHASERKKVLHANAAKYGIPLFYINTVGAQTELVFDGGSLVMNKDGNCVAEMKYFSEDFQVFELDWVKTARAVPFQSDLLFTDNPESEVRQMHQALVLGICDYFRKMGFSKAVLGLSGGIDSAVVYALAVEALGVENVLAVLLPSEYSSEHSIADAIELCNNVGGKWEKLPIANPVEATLRVLNPLFEGTSPNLTEENIQARIRGLLLMALSNKFGYILLNTTNKSEAAVGFGTLYGDMCGGLAVLGDVFKTRVYQLAHYVNRDREIIPQNTIDKAPSAELRADQKDSDSLPEYDLLDAILEAHIEQHKSEQEICAQGYEPALVNRVLKLVHTAEYKRFQMPPVLRVTRKAFGPGRRFPLVAKA